MEWRQAFYQDVVFVEAELGVEIPLPPELEPDDMNVIGTVADILRTGEGTATFKSITGIANTPGEIPNLPDRPRGDGFQHRAVIYTVFGQELNLGTGEYEIPELEIVSVVALGDRPDAPASVRLVARGSD